MVGPSLGQPMWLARGSEEDPVTPEAAAREPRSASSLFGELAEEHHAIRDLVDRLERQDGDWGDVAEELSNLLARHRSTGMDAVIARAGGADQEQQVRLLVAATRGMDQLADRLRTPARDPLLLDNILVALRGLVHEHERLETELLAADIVGATGPPDRPGGTGTSDGPDRARPV